MHFWINDSWWCHRFNKWLRKGDLAWRPALWLLLNLWYVTNARNWNLLFRKMWLWLHWDFRFCQFFLRFWVNLTHNNVTQLIFKNLFLQHNLQNLLIRRLKVFLKALILYFILHFTFKFSRLKLNFLLEFTHFHLPSWSF